jgi:hypothetical protein
VCFRDVAAGDRTQLQLRMTSSLPLLLLQLFAHDVPAWPYLMPHHTYQQCKAAANIPWIVKEQGELRMLRLLLLWLQLPLCISVIDLSQRSHVQQHAAVDM